MGCSEVQWSAIEGKGAQSSEMERNGGHHVLRVHDLLSEGYIRACKWIRVCRDRAALITQSWVFWCWIK
eukprot:1161624-Pelagomonas_calceolata.AAC.6